MEVQPLSQSITAELFLTRLKTGLASFSLHCPFLPCFSLTKLSIDLWGFPILLSSWFRCKINQHYGGQCEFWLKCGFASMKTLKPLYLTVANSRDREISTSVSSYADFSVGFLLMRNGNKDTFRVRLKFAFAASAWNSLIRWGLFML